MCERCAELCNGAMIPAVEDFNQKLLLQRGGPGRAASAQPAAAAGGLSAIPSSAATATEEALTAAAGAGMGADEVVELLGKTLISPEQLRQQLMVGGWVRSIGRATHGHGVGGCVAQATPCSVMSSTDHATRE